MAAKKTTTKKQTAAQKKAAAKKKAATAAKKTAPKKQPTKKAEKITEGPGPTLAAKTSWRDVGAFEALQGNIVAVSKALECHPGPAEREELSTSLRMYNDMLHNLTEQLYGRYRTAVEGKSEPTPAPQPQAAPPAPQQVAPTAPAPLPAPQPPGATHLPPPALPTPVPPGTTPHR